MNIAQRKVMNRIRFHAPVNHARDCADKAYLRRTWRARVEDWRRDALAYPDRVVVWGLVILVSQYLCWWR